MTAGVTDLGVHVQPWAELSPPAAAALLRGREDERDRLAAVMEDPQLLLAEMDEADVWRAGLVNYPCRDVLGFSDAANAFAVRYAAAAPGRLLPFGGVHPRFAADAAAQVDELVGMGVRCLVLHPANQLFPANAHAQGLLTLGALYRRCEDRGLPVLVLTGASDFPLARCKYGRPLELDDVAVDFPDLTIVLGRCGWPLWMDEALFVARRHRNVMLGTSGVPPHALAPYIDVLEGVADRVVWGSDWPSPGAPPMRRCLDEFLDLPLAEESKRRITRDNALRLFPA